MSTLTLLDEIDELERMLAGAAAPISTSARPGEWMAVADDDEDEDDLFGEDDLGFDDIDEDDEDADSEDDEDDLDADDDIEEPDEDL